MSKKQSKRESKQETTVIEEQKEPCLRALQKKIRNINKKLNEISELEKKREALKPEQEEKISRKDQLLEERRKYEDLIEIYKGVIADNEKAIRRAQLQQLEDLAAIIAALEYGMSLKKQHKKTVDNLSSFFAGGSIGLTLKQRIQQIANILVQVANTKGIKQSVSLFVRENQGLVISFKETETIEQKKEKENQEIKKNQLFEQTKIISSDVPSIDKSSQNSACNAPDPTSESERRKQNQKVQNNNPESAVLPSENIQKDIKPAVQNYNRENRRFQNRENGNKGVDKKRQQNYHKKTYKSKYEQKTALVENVENEQSSAQSASPQPREFKREEVKELIEDGFIVVGRPKIKAKQQQHDGRKHQRQTVKNQ